MNEEKKQQDERIADALEKIVQLLDYQNKMLTNIAMDLKNSSRR